MGTSDDDSAHGSGSEVRPYRIIDTRTRRRAGLVYVAMALIGAWVVWSIDLPAMWLTAVVPLLVLAGYQWIGAWRMPITDMGAIEIASAAASFDVGHGSATLGYRGPLAKPVWQVLLFSSTPSPDREALVTVDAMRGDVTGHYEQAVDLP